MKGGAEVRQHRDDGRRRRRRRLGISVFFETRRFGQSAFFRVGLSMTAEQSRRDAHRECRRSRRVAPRGWANASWLSAGGPRGPASRPRNGGVECPIRNAKTKRFARGRFARGERAGKRTPGARSRRRTAWRRVVPRTGRVGEKRGSDCGSRLGGPVRRRRLFFSFLLDCFPPVS